MKRIYLVFGAFVIFWIILLARIFGLSIFSHTEYKEAAAKNAHNEEPLIPMRGQILDRNGIPLAENLITFSISLPPRLGTRANRAILREEINKIAQFTSTNAEDLLKKYLAKDSPYNHNFISVVEDIKHDWIMENYPLISQNDRIRIIPVSKRNYPHKTTASHVIGYVSKANTKDIENEPIAGWTKIIGKEGLERQYDNFLQGRIGMRISKVSAFQREVELLDSIEPIENRHLQTTLDINLQKKMDNLFAQKEGAAIIMDAHSGEILAAGSYPEYDINLFVDGISHTNWNALRDNPYKPLINKFINGLYPPGSVIKMGMGLGLLEFAGINENTEIRTPPHIELGGRVFRDWKKEGHGYADLYKALKRSVDVYFYILSQKTNFEDLANVLKKMGLGAPTGVDLPNEFKGIVPSPSFKKARYKDRWYPGDSVVHSIGQGMFLTTPLQIANYTALIATGSLPTPHFLKNGDKLAGNFTSRDVLSDFQKNKLPVLREGMRQVCSSEGGTAAWATRAARANLSCKTGTAQVVGISQSEKTRIKEADMDYFERSQAWITGFLPSENPQFVITILVEHGGGGSSTAGPILAELTNALIDLGYTPQTKKGFYVKTNEDITANEIGD